MCGNIDIFIREKGRGRGGWTRFVGFPVVDASLAALHSQVNDKNVAYIERRVGKREHGTMHRGRSRRQMSKINRHHVSAGHEGAVLLQLSLGQLRICGYGRSVMGKTYNENAQYFT